MSGGNEGAAAPRGLALDVGGNSGIQADPVPARGIVYLCGAQGAALYRAICRCVSDLDGWGGGTDAGDKAALGGGGPREGDGEGLQ